MVQIFPVGWTTDQVQFFIREVPAIWPINFRTTTNAEIQFITGVKITIRRDYTYAEIPMFPFIIRRFGQKPLG